MTKFICALCFLATLCGTASGAKMPALTASFSSDAEINYSQISNAALQEALGQMLEKEGITFREISVSSYENGQGGIFINEIAVYGPSDSEKSLRLIRENTGLDKEVRVYE